MNLIIKIFDRRLYFSIMIGLGAGFINGLFGAGGGMIVVFALAFFLNLKQHKAHATSISIILPLTLASLTIYFLNGHVDFELSSKVIPGGLVGSFIGARFLNICPEHILSKVFGAFIIFAAIRMIL